jgi:hypothetical protein
MGKKGKKNVQAAKRPAAAARDESDDESPADAIHVRIDFAADLRLVLFSSFEKRLSARIRLSLFLESLLSSRTAEAEERDRDKENSCFTRSLSLLLSLYGPLFVHCRNLRI